MNGSQLLSVVLTHPFRRHLSFYAWRSSRVPTFSFFCEDYGLPCREINEFRPHLELRCYTALTLGVPAWFTSSAPSLINLSINA
jgi:hypothetical protein